MSLFTHCHYAHIATPCALLLFLHCCSSHVLVPCVVPRTIPLALHLLRTILSAPFFLCYSFCIASPVLQLCVALLTLQLFFHCRSSCATFFALLFLSCCCSLHVAFLAPSHIVPIPVSLISVVLLVLPLLFFSCYHCYFHVVALFCLVNIVFPLPLPCVSRSSKLQHQFKH